MKGINKQMWHDWTTRIVQTMPSPERLDFLHTVVQCWVFRILIYHVRRMCFHRSPVHSRVVVQWLARLARLCTHRSPFCEADSRSAAVRNTVDQPRLCQLLLLGRQDVARHHRIFVILILPAAVVGNRLRKNTLRANTFHDRLFDDRLGHPNICRSRSLRTHRFLRRRLRQPRDEIVEPSMMDHNVFVSWHPNVCHRRRWGRRWFPRRRR